MKNPAVSALLLWLLLALFSLRVIGQLVVVRFHPRWLPPMAQWYSGLIPYRFLLPIQAAFLIVMAAVAYDFSRGAGVFVAPRPPVGQAVLWFSYAYFAGMVVRYVLRMWRRPDQRWFGGSIPIVFHWVLAAYLFVFASYHVP